MEVLNEVDTSLLTRRAEARGAAAKRALEVKSEAGMASVGCVDGSARGRSGVFVFCFFFFLPFSFLVFFFVILFLFFLLLFFLFSFSASHPAP